MQTTEYLNRFKVQTRNLLRDIQLLEATVQEGKDRGFVSPDDGTTPGSLQDSDLLASQLSYLSAAQFAAVVVTLDTLKTSLDANNKTIRVNLYQVIG